MKKRIFGFFKIWGNLLIGAITVYPFVVTYVLPSSVQEGKLTSLFGWSWQTWLIIFLVSIIITLIIENLLRQEKEKTTESAPANTTTTKTKTGDFSPAFVNSPVDTFNSLLGEKMTQKMCQETGMKLILLNGIHRLAIMLNVELKLSITN